MKVWAVTIVSSWLASGSASGQQTEDFFWAAPLGETPRLAAVTHPEQCDGEARRKIDEVTYIGPSYFARSITGISQTDCFQFQSSSVQSLDHPEGKKVVMSEVFRLKTPGYPGL
jgi:hypothetical protein